MAVRQLAGPFPLEVFTGDVPAVESPPAFDVSHMQWYEGVGLFGSVDGVAGICSIDGVFQPVHYYVPFTVGWWADNHRLLNIGPGVYDTTEFVREPKALMETFTESIFDSEWLKTYVRFGDTRYFFDVFRIKTLKAGVITVDSDAFPFIDAKVWMGRNDREIFFWEVGADDTRFGFYDIVAKEIVALYHLGRGVSQLTYAPDLQVVISRHNPAATSEIRVWSLEVQPTIVTNAVLIAGAAKGGLIATYQVQVTGAQNDPAEGEVVDWSLTGVGRLLDLQSETDANGHATTRVRYGLTDTGNSTVEASVRC